MKKVLIVGANSAIAVAVGRLYAARGDSLYLLGRNSQRLAELKEDLLIRGAASVDHAAFDARDPSRHEEIIDSVFDVTGELDIALVCHGSLPDQAACEASGSTTLEEVTVNGSSVISLLTPIANRMAARGSGSIAAITSVAADRGRQSNYIYGAAKAMVSTFLQGLRNRLHSRGVSVTEIRPGFVDTPMTAEFDKGLLWAQPEQVASDIVKAIDKRKSVIYTPVFWRLIMCVIRSIPEFIFVRLSL